MWRVFSLPSFESAVSAPCPWVCVPDSSFSSVVTLPTGSTWMVLFIYHSFLARDWLFRYLCSVAILGWSRPSPFQVLPVCVTWRGCVFLLPSSFQAVGDSQDLSGWCHVCDPRRGFWAEAPHALVISPANSLHVLAGELVQRATVFKNVTLLKSGSGDVPLGTLWGDMVRSL